MSWPREPSLARSVLIELVTSTFVTDLGGFSPIPYDQPPAERAFPGRELGPPVTLWTTPPNIAIGGRGLGWRRTPQEERGCGSQRSNLVVPVFDGP